MAILFLLCIFKLEAQTYNYSYTDPCTGVLKTITVPINGSINVAYYGEVGSFYSSDFTDGTFEAWASNIFTQYGQNSPCSQIVGLGTTLNVTQSTALNVLGILNSLTSISDLASGATNILGGSVSSISNSSNGNSNNKNNKNGNNSTNNNSSNSSNNGNNSSNQSIQNPQGTSQESPSTSSNPTGGTNEGSSNPSNPLPTGGGTETGQGNTGGSEPNPETTGGAETQPTTSGSEGTGTEGNGTQQQGSEGTNPTQENPQTTSEEGKGKTNITAGATNTTKAAGNGEGGKPTVVASSDFVGFNFKNSEVKNGLKATGGYTALRWDGQRSWGALADYTSALKGPNVTGFYAWIKPKSIAIASATLTVGFEGNKSIYGTLAGGQMFTFPKIPRFKAVYMGTVSYGSVYRTEFLGTALIAGAMYDIKIGKRIDIKLTDLLVYAPYVSYYNDVVLKSPWVMLPSIGTNIGITKKFKFNINAGGAWDLKTSALNYTITCGTRMLIGQ